MKINLSFWRKKKIRLVTHLYCSMCHNEFTAMSGCGMVKGKKGKLYPFCSFCRAHYASWCFNGKKFAENLKPATRENLERGEYHKQIDAMKSGVYIGKTSFFDPPLLKWGEDL